MCPQLYVAFCDKFYQPKIHNKQQQNLLALLLYSVARTIKQIYDFISCILTVADFIFIVQLQSLNIQSYIATRQLLLIFYVFLTKTKATLH